jgi:hypothetical protein
VIRSCEWPMQADGWSRHPAAPRLNRPNQDNPTSAFAKINGPLGVDGGQPLVTSLRSGGGVKRRRDRWAQAVATLPGTCLDLDFAEGWVRIGATSSIYWLAVMPPST